MSATFDSSSFDSTTGPATTGVAPGWYQDPSAPGQQRYWDGTAWTTQIVPSGTPAHTTTDGGASRGLVFAGWLCAVLFPLGGIVLGLTIKNADKNTGRTRGAWILGVSIVWLIVCVLITIAAAASAPDYNYSGYSY
jgi:serine/threonine-protein kinase